MVRNDDELRKRYTDKGAVDKDLQKAVLEFGRNLIPHKAEKQSVEKSFQPCHCLPTPGREKIWKGTTTYID